MSRWAIVYRLESGLLSTASKRGVVDWCSTLDDAIEHLRITRLGMKKGACGYLKPSYELFASPGLFPREKMDVVVNVQAVPEGEWDGTFHHQLPCLITRE